MPPSRAASYFMALFNFVINLIGVALWTSWLSSRFDAPTKTAAVSLAATLKRTNATRPRRWRYLAYLCALLLARAWICRQKSSSLNWTPKLKFVAVVLSFRADFASHLLVFSLLSFGVVLAGFYLWLLLLSFGKNHAPNENPFLKLIQFPLKWLGRVPVALKLFFPFALGSIAWLALHPLLARMAVLPSHTPTAQLLEQAAVIGVGTYLAWKYLIIGILVFYMLHSYVHLGEHPVWAFVDGSARDLLRPLRGLPLRVGRHDLLPPVVIAIVVLIAIFAGRIPPLAF